MTKHVVLALLLLLMPVYLFPQTPTFSEYEVKASFLEKFTRFIEWPAESQMEDVSKPFVLAVIGENPFESILDTTYSKQTIKGKSVDIRYISDVKDIDGCDLMFVSKSENDSISQILSRTGDKPILTVCDDIGFAKKGILITLFIEDGYVHFAIDESAAERTGLYISSLLLDLSAAMEAGESKE